MRHELQACGPFTETLLHNPQPAICLSDVSMAHDSEGLVEETLPQFLEARHRRPLAWLNVDLDLYGGTIAALRALGPHVVRGGRIHFHELQSEPHTHTPEVPGQASDHLGDVVHEVQALREFMVAFPCVRLKLEDVAPNGAYDSSAAFVVTRGALDCHSTPPT